MAVTVGLFSYGGHLLDQQLSTSPVFVIVGFVLGAGGGFLHLVKVIAPELLPFGKRTSQPEDPDQPDETNKE